MSLSGVVMDPLRGKTSLAKVFWLYGVVGSFVVSVIGTLIDSGSVLGRAFVAFCVLFSVYQIVATYQCAPNCRSKGLTWFIRICVVLSLLLLPVLGYLELSGKLDGVLTGLVGGGIHDL